MISGSAARIVNEHLVGLEHAQLHACLFFDHLHAGFQIFQLGGQLRVGAGQLQIGGLVGIFLGILVGNIVTPLLGGSFLIPWAWMFLGFTLCMVVGVVSGFYPAMKAVRLDPIESLRYE